MDKDKFAQALKGSIPFIILVLGLISFAYSVFGSFETNSKWKIFLHGVGEFSIVGGVFGVLLKSFQFMEIYKKELIDIIYEGKYLRNRKDLAEIWERVSKIMFENKFQGISGNVTNDVKTVYFPTNQVLYYDEYTQETKIKLIEPGKDKIEATQTSSFYVHAVSLKSKITLPFKNSIPYKESTKNDCSYTLKQLKIDGEPQEVLFTSDFDDTNKLVSTYNVVLEGSLKYKIDIEVAYSYNLRDDPFIGFQKDFIINGFTLKLHFEHPLELLLMESGTLSTFYPETKT